jgi:hypothetical protein
MGALLTGVDVEAAVVHYDIIHNSEDTVTFSVNLLNTGSVVLSANDLLARADVWADEVRDHLVGTVWTTGVVTLYRRFTSAPQGVDGGTL